MAYPPSYTECQRLFEELKQLDLSSEDEFNDKKYEIIHDLAEVDFYEAKSYFVEGLKNPDPDYRWACINAIATDWQDGEIVPQLLEMAENDPDTTVLGIAISALGMFKLQKALPILKRILENKRNDLYVRKEAYLAILRISELLLEKEALALAMRDAFEPDVIDENLLRW